MFVIESACEDNTQIGCLSLLFMKSLSFIFELFGSLL